MIIPGLILYNKIVIKGKPRKPNHTKNKNIKNIPNTKNTTHHYKNNYHH